MTASIEGLLQTAAEKKRLEEELRIARQIQMSLLPRGPLDVPGLAITALCVPAREVGGDYYDFFPLSDDRLGVLIADVSGKGTSAALYMAELKGVVLALSQRYDSPRELLIEVNRIISENLDSRSFITVTYAVIDTRKGVMTYCRAGHTSLIYLPSTASPAQAAQVLTPSGMVLGLRIDGAAEAAGRRLVTIRVRDHRFVQRDEHFTHVAAPHEETRGFVGRRHAGHRLQRSKDVALRTRCPVNLNRLQRQRSLGARSG